MESKYQRFTNLLGKLKRNRDSVPKEVLKTKYGVAYRRLQTELQETATAILKEVLFVDYIWNEGEQNVLTEGFSYAQKRIEELGYLKAVGKAVFSACDEDLFFWYVCLIKTEYDKEYMPYWLANCRMVAGLPYNQLIDALYEAEGSYWYRVEKSDKKIIRYGFPPTEDAYLQEIQEMVNELKANIRNCRKQKDIG